MVVNKRFTLMEKLRDVIRAEKRGKKTTVTVLLQDINLTAQVCFKTLLGIGVQKLRILGTYTFILFHII